MYNHASYGNARASWHRPKNSLFFNIRSQPCCIWTILRLPCSRRLIAGRIHWNTPADFSFHHAWRNRIYQFPQSVSTLFPKEPIMFFGVLLPEIASAAATIVVNHVVEKILDDLADWGTSASRKLACVVFQPIFFCFHLKGALHGYRLDWNTVRCRRNHHWGNQEQITHHRAATHNGESQFRIAMFPSFLKPDRHVHRQFTGFWISAVIPPFRTIGVEPRICGRR